MIFVGVIQSAASPYENRAQIFFTQVESVELISLSGTIKDAVNQLFIDLDAAGLIDLTDDTGASDKIYACYPFVGGQAGSHKYNMLRPTDTDGDFRLEFSGGWTHTSGGAESNGSTGFANVNLNPNTVLSATNHHVSFRNSINRATGTVMDLGSFSTPNALYLASKFSSNIILYSDNSSDSTVANTDSTGFYCGTRTVGTHRRVYKDTTEVINAANTSGTLSNNTLFLGALNASGATWYVNGKYTWLSVGEGLDATEEGDLFTAQDTFQTALSR